MCSRLLVVLLCIAECVGVLLAMCITTGHEGNYGDRIQCQNDTMATLTYWPSPNVTAVMIYRSALGTILRENFARFSKNLRSLNIHQCRITDIRAEAFSDLVNLRKLSLPNNNISVVKEDWFTNTVYLEQLDLSYNQIASLSPMIFSKMMLLQRLDVRHNRLTCFDYARLPGGISKVYFFGNPLTFLCRGKLTLWMRDHGVSYTTGISEEREWLDKLLWLCAIDDPDVAQSELYIKQCVLFNLFGQLRTGLVTAETYPLSYYNCTNEVYNMVYCAATKIGDDRTRTNARVISDLMMYLRRAKSA